MFLSDTFIIVVVVLIGALAGLYFLGVYIDVFDGLFSLKPDYRERAAELLNAYRKKQKNREKEARIEREMNNL